MNDLDHAARQALEIFLAECGLADHQVDGPARVTLRIEDAPMSIALAEEPVPHLMLSTPLAALSADDDIAPGVLLQGGLASWARGVMTVILDDDDVAHGLARVPIEHAGHLALGDVAFGLATAAAELRRALIDAGCEVIGRAAPAEGAPA